MNLLKRYNTYLLLDHNKDYYFYNTFPIRFLKSQTTIREISQIFFNDGLILLILCYQINLFYKINLYFFFIFWGIFYLIGILKFFITRIIYKGFYKSIFKCLDCGKLTKIRLNNCQHCNSVIHKNQTEYIEKRNRSIVKKKLNIIKRCLNNLEKYNNNKIKY